MSPEEINTIADQAATRAIERYAEQHKCAGCLCEIHNEQHYKDHAFVQGAMTTYGKVNKVKWAVYTAISVAAVFGMLALLGVKIKH